MKKLIFALLLCGLLFILIAGILEMPALGSIDNQSYNEVAHYYIDNSINDTNAPNMISAIMTDYRFFDTLGETIVLFTAITVVISVRIIAAGKSHYMKGDNIDG